MSRSVSLVLLAILLLGAGAGYQLVAFEKKSKSGNVVVKGKFARVPGVSDKVNARLKAFSTRRDPEAFEKEDPAFYAENHYTEEVDTEVTLLSDRYVSIHTSSIGMLERAAHPNLEFGGLTLSLKTGEAVTLDQLLKPGYGPALYQKLAAAADKEFHPEVALEDRKKWDFVLTRDGVRFINLFQGHAAASATLTLTWKELAALKAR